MNVNNIGSIDNLNCGNNYGIIGRPSRGNRAQTQDPMSFMHPQPPSFGPNFPFDRSIWASDNPLTNPNWGRERTERTMRTVQNGFQNHHNHQSTRQHTTPHIQQHRQTQSWGDASQHANSRPPHFPQPHPHSAPQMPSTSWNTAQHAHPPGPPSPSPQTHPHSAPPTPDHAWGNYPGGYTNREEYDEPGLMHSTSYSNGGIAQMNQEHWGRRPTMRGEYEGPGPTHTTPYPNEPAQSSDQQWGTSTYQQSPPPSPAASPSASSEHENTRRAPMRGNSDSSTSSADTIRADPSMSYHSPQPQRQSTGFFKDERDTAWQRKDATRDGASGSDVRGNRHNATAMVDDRHVQQALRSMHGPSSSQSRRRNATSQSGFGAVAEELAPESTYDHYVEARRATREEHARRDRSKQKQRESLVNDFDGRALYQNDAFFSSDEDGYGIGSGRAAKEEEAMGGKTKGKQKVVQDRYDTDESSDEEYGYDIGTGRAAKREEAMFCDGKKAGLDKVDEARDAEKSMDEMPPPPYQRYNTAVSRRGTTRTTNTDLGSLIDTACVENGPIEATVLAREISRQSAESDSLPTRLDRRSCAGTSASSRSTNEVSGTPNQSGSGSDVTHSSCTSESGGDYKKKKGKRHVLKRLFKLGKN